MRLYLEEESKKKIVRKLALAVFQKSQENIMAYKAVDTGFLAKSGKIIPDEFGATITYDAPYAHYVEYGSFPHMPPVAPIKEWVKRKITADEKDSESIAWAVAKNISKNGVKERPFLRNALYEVLGN